MKKKAWKWIAAGGSIAVFRLLQIGSATLYESLTGKEPPENPAERGVQIKDALLWTVLASVIAGVGKLLFDTLLAHKWRDDAVKPSEISG